MNASTHLLLHVIERVWRIDSKTDENNMRVGVREWAETIVIFLTRRIPQGELDVFAINLNIGYVVLEYSWHINLNIAPFVEA